MCGRYATSRTAVALNQRFEIDLANSLTELSTDYNAAPTKALPIVIEREKDGNPPVRQLRLARWGLVPSWAKDASIGNRMINARSETVAEKPAFKRAFAKRRAIVPADGYYEWYASNDAVGKVPKQPFYITPKDRGILAMAGLYEFWKNPDDGEWLTSFTILTTSAEDDLGHIHDRMPLMVEPDRYAEWLNPAPIDVLEVRDLLVPAAPGLLDAIPVSTQVNNVRNNGPELVKPLEISH